MLLLRIVIFVCGLVVVGYTLLSAICSFVLPRSASDRLIRIVFRAVLALFNLRLRKAPTYAERDGVMALYAPVSLLTLPAVWLLLVTGGYTAMFWAVGDTRWYAALTVSGSSLFTLGFATARGLPSTLLSFSEAALGLTLVALLIAYLPTMYASFSRRESLVTMLEVRAGTPPSAVELLMRYNRLQRMERLTDIWSDWEVWFADVEESHTSFPALTFFRSPQADHSWVTAAGAVLDTAAITVSSVEIPHDVQADLCLRAGYLALRRIADYFSIEYNATPHYPEDLLSISREEFDMALDQLAAAGVPLKEDREKSWLGFAGWRVNYDTVLLALAALTMAPYAPWSSDRSLATWRRPPRLFKHWRASGGRR